MKNSKRCTILCSLLVLMLMVSCEDNQFNHCIVGNNRVVTDEITGLPSFTGIYHASAADVKIAKGNFFEVLISGEENLIDEIDFRVSNGKLMIETRRNICLTPHQPIEISITMPALESVVLAGSGNIRSDDPFDADEFRTELIGSGNIMLTGIAGTLDALLSGSGNFMLGFDTEEIKLDLIGSGNVTLSGSTDLLDILLAGSGNIFAFYCLAQEANVTVAGSGTCDVNVVSTLDVVISGSGNVRYRGNPVVNVTISGSGSLVNAN